jgi:hypothetical protein
MGAHRDERHGRRRDGASQARRDPSTIPHDEVAERLIAGAFLAFGEDHAVGMMRVCLDAGLSHESFFVAQVRCLWVEIEALVVAGKSVGSLAVLLALNEAGTLEAAGGPATVERMANDVVLRGTWSSVKEAFVASVLNLRRKEIDREAQRRARTLAEAIATSDHEAAAEQARKLSELVGHNTRVEMPQILGWDAFVRVERPKPPELIAGVLHRGAKLMLGGGSKSFKTWCLLDMGLSVATGRPWWGIRTEQAAVLYVNFELQVEFCQERVREIAKAKEIAEAPLFQSWHLRGYARDLRELVPVFISRTAGAKIGLIILDPIYKALGERDENSNGEVAQLLNEVEALAVRTGAAIAFGHHFSKGNQSAKDSRDRVSGAGSWTRDPDALITLTPHEEEGCFAAEFTLRNCKQKDPFVLRWTHPVMQSAPGLSPTALREPGRPKEHTADKLLGVLGSASMTYKTWADKCEHAGVSPSSFKRLLAQLKEQGKVKQTGPLYEAI